MSRLRRSILDASRSRLFGPVFFGRARSLGGRACSSNVDKLGVNASVKRHSILLDPWNIVLLRFNLPAEFFVANQAPGVPRWRLASAGRLEYNIFVPFSSRRKVSHEALHPYLGDAVTIRIYE